MESKEFSEQYMKLCFAFDKEYKEGQMLVYLEFIGALRIEPLRYAVNKAILSSRYFPRIAELIDLMKEYQERIPAERQLGGIEEKPVPMPDYAKKAIDEYIRKNTSERGAPPEPLELSDFESEVN